MSARWVKVFLAICISLTFFLKGSGLIFAAEPDRLVRVGVYDNNPKVFRQTNGKMSGLFPDILDYIASQEHWKIDYVYGTWEEGLSRLERGDINIMVDVAISDERQLKYDFSRETVLSSWGVVYVRRGSEVDSFLDLDGKKIAILSSSVYLGGPQGIEKYFKSFGLTDNFVKVDEYEEVFNMLNLGTVDAAIVSRIFGLAHEKVFPNLKSTNIFFDPTELRFALTKGSPDNPYLIEKLDFWIKRLKDGHEGIYQKVLHKYDLAGLSDQKEVIPNWLIFAVAGLAAVLVISLLIIFVLKRARESITQQLRQKEFLLNNVVDHVPMFIFSINNHNQFTLIEGKGTSTPGFTPTDWVGKSVLELFKDNSTALYSYRQALSGTSVEVKLKFADLTWLINLVPLKESGRVVSIAGTAIDYTQKEKLDKAKQDFVSLASHHLRTPPTEIKWCQELLLPKILTVLDKAELRLWNQISDANSRIIDLANVLSFSYWLELNDFESSPETFSLPDLIDDEINKIREKLDSKKIELTTHIASIPPVKFDKKQIGIVIGSLLSNAVRYTPPGGHIELKLQEKGKHPVLFVRDSGIGIPASQQDKIFTRLFRADNVAQVDTAGVGLALYISKMIIDKLGGKIYFRSVEGKGSTFFVELPRI